MTHSFLDEVLILLILSVLTVALLRKVNLSPILGYLFVGAAIGPHALGLLAGDESIHMLAEIGVVFLLFMIGMEISFPRLVTMKGAVFGVGGAQVIGGVISGGLIAWLIGIPWQAALIVGGALAMSSTALAVKQLNEQLEMQTRHGRLALAILLFQDIAVVPFLVIIPIFADDSQQALAIPLLIAFLKGIVAFGLMFSLGRWVLRPLFHQIAGAHSAELFTLTTLMVALTAAWLTNQLGLSLALGAFLGGMMLAETEYRHQISTDVRPFRDVLMAIFFISIGLQVDFSVIVDLWYWVVLLVIGLILGKGLLIFITVRIAGYENGVAVRTGAVLAQGGEFGFALLALALSQGLLDLDSTQPILSAIILSMAIAPLLIRNNRKIANYFFGDTYLKNIGEPVREVEAAAESLDNHIIISGFNRIGQHLSNFLRQENLRYLALDMDPVLIREAWEAGESVYYGDSGNSGVLEAAGLEKARALVITYDDPRVSKYIIRAARHINKDIPIIVRTHDDVHMEELEEAGADIVVPEVVEGSMTLATQLLRKLGVNEDELKRLIDSTRDQHYSNLRGFFHGESLESIEEDDPFHLHTVVLIPGSHAIGKSLKDCELGKIDTLVTLLRRNKIRDSLPHEDTILESGDALVLQGTPDNLQHAEEVLLQG